MRPHPYVPLGGQPELWRQEGLLLGVLEAQFPARSHTLKTGDKLLIYTDGIDTATFENHLPGTDSLLACAARHRELPVAAFVEQIARDLFGGVAQPDDLTLLGLEITG